MQLVVKPSGAIETIYEELIDLCSLGRLQIARASHVEPAFEGSWFADLKPVDGPVLGPFNHRSEALEAERAWLETHWLTRPG